MAQSNRKNFKKQVVRRLSAKPKNPPLQTIDINRNSRGRMLLKSVLSSKSQGITDSSSHYDEDSDDSVADPSYSLPIRPPISSEDEESLNGDQQQFQKNILPISNEEHDTTRLTDFVGSTSIPGIEAGSSAQQEFQIYPCDIDVAANEEHPTLTTFVDSIYTTGKEVDSTEQQEFLFSSSEKEVILNEHHGTLLTPCVENFSFLGIETDSSRQQELIADSPVIEITPNNEYSTLLTPLVENSSVFCIESSFSGQHELLTDSPKIEITRNEEHSTLLTPFVENSSGLVIDADSIRQQELLAGSRVIGISSNEENITLLAPFVENSSVLVKEADLSEEQGLLAGSRVIEISLKEQNFTLLNPIVENSTILVKETNSIGQQELLACSSEINITSNDEHGTLLTPFVENSSGLVIDADSIRQQELLAGSRVIGISSNEENITLLAPFIDNSSVLGIKARSSGRQELLAGSPEIENPPNEEHSTLLTPFIQNSSVLGIESSSSEQQELVDGLCVLETCISPNIEHNTLLPPFIENSSVPDAAGGLSGARNPEQNVIVGQPEKEAKSVKNKRKYPIIALTCRNKCNRKCSNFSENDREYIWNSFWELDYTSRRKWLAKMIQIKNVKRRRSEIVMNPEPEFKKNESRYYYLPKDNVDTQVCRSFFLQTLGFKNDSVLTELSRAIKRKAVCADVKENRGGKKPKIVREPVIEHITSFNPTVSHYRRHNAPLTKYLPQGLTLEYMFKDFVEKNPGVKCSKELYRITLKQLKISFHTPKSDACDQCISLEEGLKTNPDNEHLKEQLISHKNKANTAIESYKKDTALIPTNQEKMKVFSMDLQKVILLPIMPAIKEAFFLSRLIVFNLTFASLRKNADSYCILWHEAIAGRDAQNIVDAIITFIKAERDIENFVIWADNCTAQNKNWILYTSLVCIVNSRLTQAKTITLKYLTKGHTHMSADSVHGNIESHIRRQRNIYDFADFKTLVMKARKNNSVLELGQQHNWLKKKRSTKKEEDPLKSFTLNSIVEARFKEGSTNLFYKTDFTTESYKEIDFLMKKYNPSVVPQEIARQRGIKSNKKEDILTKLVPLMPDNRKEFWRSLPANDAVVDLVTEGEMVTYDQ